jgi:hypothetical protein
LKIVTRVLSVLMNTIKSKPTDKYRGRWCVILKREVSGRSDIACQITILGSADKMIGKRRICENDKGWKQKWQANQMSFHSTNQTSSNEEIGKLMHSI